MNYVREEGIFVGEQLRMPQSRKAAMENRILQWKNKARTKWNDAFCTYLCHWQDSGWFGEDGLFLVDSNPLRQLHTRPHLLNCENSVFQGVSVLFVCLLFMFCSIEQSCLFKGCVTHTAHFQWPIHSCAMYFLITAPIRNNYVPEFEILLGASIGVVLVIGVYCTCIELGDNGWNSALLIKIQRCH